MLGHGSDSCEVGTQVQAEPRSVTAVPGKGRMRADVHILAFAVSQVVEDILIAELSIGTHRSETTRDGRRDARARSDDAGLRASCHRCPDRSPTSGTTVACRSGVEAIGVRWRCPLGRLVR